MNGRNVIGIAGILVSLLLVLFFLLMINLQEDEYYGDQTLADNYSTSIPVSDYFGNQILQDYGSDHVGIEDDIRKMGELLRTYRTLAKGVDPYYFSVNEEVAKLFTGDGIVGIQAITRDHPCLKDGQIVDRWGSPLLFHAVSGRNIDIYSAGPDTIIGTEDDLAFDGRTVVTGKPSF